MISLTLRRRAYWIGDYYVDRGGYVTREGKGSALGHVLTGKVTKVLSTVGEAVLLGAPLPVVEIKRRR